MPLDRVHYAVMLLRQDGARVANVRRLLERYPHFDVFPALHWKYDQGRIGRTLAFLGVSFRGSVSCGHIALWASLLAAMQEHEKIDCDYHVLLEDDAVLPDDFDVLLKKHYLDSCVLDETPSSRLGKFATGVVYRRGYFRELLSLAQEVGIDRGVDHFQANVARDSYNSKLPRTLMLMPTVKIVGNANLASNIQRTSAARAAMIFDNKESKMIDADWVDAVRCEVPLSNLFRYAPARAQPRGLILLAGGGVGMGANNEFVSWEVTTDEHLQVPILKLHRADNCLLLTMNSDGQWCGRDADGGRVHLTCISSRRDRWKQLASQRSFFQGVVVDPDEPNFRYREPLSNRFNWGSHAFHIQEEVKGVRLPETQVAVAVVAHDRPIYFSQVIKALANNKRIRELPVFVFLDYSPEIGKTDEQEKLVREVLPGCVIVRRPVNFGCGRNIIDARRQLFDNLGYDRAFFFEDDMVPSSTYLTYCERLLDWAEENYTDVGAVQGWNQCVMSPGLKEKHLREVRGTFANWWGYLMSKKCWDTFSPLIYKYEELFLSAERYNQRPHRSIIDWFHRKDEWRRDIPGQKFPVDKIWEAAWKRHFRNPATGQDAATEHLFHRAGWVRLAPTVNRGLYIGKQGIHMNPELFSRDGFDVMNLDEFDEPGEFTGVCTRVQQETLSGFKHVGAQ